MIVHAGTALDSRRAGDQCGRSRARRRRHRLELATARHAAYATIAQLRLPGAFYRTDIARQAADDAAAQATARHESAQEQNAQKETAQ